MQGKDATHVADVFPAHAGMSREPSRWPCWMLSFPRSRGDEPSAKRLSRLVRTFSPLTRG